MTSRTPLLAVLLVLLLASACDHERQATPFAPGLGEIMALQQMRHSKLWFAGQAGNWELCAYETDELEEGFDDAMHFHPTHKTSPQPLTEAVPLFTKEPVKALRQAVAARDRDQFEQAFDALTAGCNGCHRATNFSFNVVVRPQQNGYSNQDFAAPK
jgi:hypothetical protein